MDAIKVAEELVSKGIRNVRVILPDGEQLKLRLARSSSGSVMYLFKGKHRCGELLQHLNPIEIHPVISRKTVESKWLDAWKKVKARLLISGLWENIVKDIDIALTVGYDRMNQACKEYWKIPYKDGSQDITSFSIKYPELMETNDKGRKYINTSLLWMLAKHPKVKKMVMYSNVDINETTMALIHHSMINKQPISLSGRAAYDTSFQYKPDVNKAWYSEEFKGCGNGHYYIVIDATHALFCEND